MPTTPTLEPEQADRSRLQPKLADREEARRGGHPAPPSQARHLPELLRSNWRVATLATASIAALSGFAIGLAMPRGPVTSAQALALMGTGIVVGLAAGFILHSRWAMLLVPAVHVGTFELGRLGAQGPTVTGFIWTRHSGFSAYSSAVASTVSWVCCPCSSAWPHQRGELIRPSATSLPPATTNRRPSAAARAVSGAGASALLPLAPSTSPTLRPRRGHVSAL